MTKYRMVVLKSGLLWQSHDIFATDDATAKDLAQQRFDELATTLFRQRVANPELERFIIYDGIRVVCEVVPRGSR
jgi:hypothetical protein